MMLNGSQSRGDISTPSNLTSSSGGPFITGRQSVLESPALSPREVLNIDTQKPSDVEPPVSAMYAGGYGSPPTNMGADVTAIGQQPSRNMRPQSDINSEGYDPDAIVSAGNRSVGAPTPTSAASSYAPGMREDGSLAAVVGGRRQSDFGTEDSYGGPLDQSYGARGNEVSPEYGMETVGSMEYESAAADNGMGHRGSVDMGMESRSEGTRGVLKMKTEGGRDDQLPTWSETKTKAGKDRKRLPLACIACRRKKIRCSGEKPACKHCLRSRIPCVYKQSTRKTAPRTDYMAMLDRRLKRMEERLLKNVPKDEVSSILATTGRSVVKPTATSTKMGAAGKKRTADVAFDDDLDAWAYTTGSTKQKGIGGEAWKVAPPTAGKGAEVDPDDGASALPPRDLQEHLAEVFFDYVYGQPYLLLHKPSFMRRLRSGTAPPVLVLAICAVSARFSKHPAVRHDPPFLAGESFASEARRQLLKNFDNPNITNLTVCIILGLHEFGTCQGGRSWALGGMATRMAHALQLHKEAEHDPMGKLNSNRPDYVHEGGVVGGYMSFTDKEIRRRCMWACFAMDRFNSSGTERPTIINEDEVEIQLPVHDRNLELDNPAITEQLDGGVKDMSDDKDEGKLQKAAENMGIGAYLIRIVALFGRVVRYLNQGGKEKDRFEMWDPKSRFVDLSAELNTFAEDMPQRFFYTPENLQIHSTEKLVGQFVFLHVAYHQVRLFLHRSALSASGYVNGAMPKAFADTANETCLDAANRIAQILNDSQNRGFPAVAPFIGYCAFNASLVHLVRMFSGAKDARTEAKKYMEICLKYLLQLRQYWGLFCSITDNLKMLYRRFSESSARGHPLMGHQETARALQYGDWFHKYPKGVSASEYEDSAVRGRAAECARANAPDAALSHRSDLQTADEFFARLGPRRGDEASPRVDPNFKQQCNSMLPRRVQSADKLGELANKHPPNARPHNYPPPIQIPSSTRHNSNAGIHHQGPMSAKVPSQPLPSPLTAGIPPAVPSSSPYPGNMHRNSISHQTPPSPAIVQNVQQQVPFSAYPQQIARNPMEDAAANFHAGTPTPTTQPYAYDSYPGGADFVGGVNNNMWNGFNHPINAADANAFVDQTSSAWFMPFNSIPPEFDPGGLEAFGLLTAGMQGEGIGSGGGRPDGGDGGQAVTPHMMSAGSRHVVSGSLPSPHATYQSGGQ